MLNSKAKNENKNEGFICETGAPHIEIDGGKICLIEGSKGIIEYSEETVRINCGNLIFQINGFDLILEGMENDRIRVCGKIISTEFSY